MDSSELNQKEAIPHIAHCPHTGLAILQKPEWINVSFGSSYRLNIQIIGRRILFIQTEGIGTYDDLSRALQLTDSIVREYIGEQTKYIRIEDLSHFKGISTKARKYYIQKMAHDEPLERLIYLNPPLLVRISIKISKRLKMVSFNVDMAHSYTEAVNMALFIFKNRVKPQKMTSKSLEKEDKSIETILSKGISFPHWFIKMENFGQRFEILDDTILHITPFGYLEEDSLSPIFNLQENVVHSPYLNKNHYYIVINLLEITGISMRGRLTFIKKMVEFNQQYPFKALIFYCPSWLLQAAINLYKPFVPFRVKIAKDKTDAIKYILEDTRGTGKEKPKSKKRPDRTSQHLEELLRYIGSIDWEKNGFDPKMRIHPEHPLRQVFDAIAFIKHEVDDLFQDRKMAELKLLESKKKYKSILDNIKEGYFEVDLDGNLIFFNRTFCSITGYSESDLNMQKLSDLLDEENTGILFNIFSEMQTESLPSKIFDLSFERKNGNRCFVEISITVIGDSPNTKTGYRGMMRDLTEKRRAEIERDKLEIQLSNAQKMQAIGVLAGGIAHNFNNLLTGIQGNASLLQLEKSVTPDQLKKLTAIEQLVQSGSRLTSQLIGYARQGKYEVKPLDLNRLIRDTVNTFSSSREEIEMITDLAPDLQMILADKSQMEQVLLNLLLNAGDAMPEGGNIRIETSNMTHSEITSKPYQPIPGKYIHMSVTDSGTGIKEEIVDRIFDPFFTTKEKNQGSGLGLASVYGVIKTHNGYIDVISNPSRGSRFNIYLPSSDGKPKGEAPISEQLMTGKETILLVDDEDMILYVGRQMLKYLGYNIISARGGLEALFMYEENKKLIDLVILDMIMPKMGGQETFNKLRKMNPAVKVLLASGYSSDGKAQEIINQGCDGFIQKPFNLTQLSHKVREILDTRKKDKN